MAATLTQFLKEPELGLAAEIKMTVKHTRKLTVNQHARKIRGLCHYKAKDASESVRIHSPIPAWFRAIHRVHPGVKTLDIYAPGYANLASFIDMDGNDVCMQVGGATKYRAWNPNEPDLIPGIYFEFDVPYRVRKTNYTEERVDWPLVYEQMCKENITYKQTAEYQNYVMTIGGIPEEVTVEL